MSQGWAEGAGARAGTSHWGTGTCPHRWAPHHPQREGLYQDGLDLILVTSHVVQNHVLCNVLAVLQLVHFVIGVRIQH